MTVSPVRQQPFFHTRPSACLRANEAPRSAAPSVLSAIAAALLAVPLFTSHQARNHPQYRKLAPSAAVTAVAASLLLRPRRRSARRSTRYSSREVSSDKHTLTLKDNLAEPQTGNGLFTTSKQAWDESKQALANDFSSDAPQGSAAEAASSSSSTYSISYRNRTRTEGNGVEGNIRSQPAVPMDTSSVFEHMRAEFVSESEPAVEGVPSKPATFTDDQKDNTDDTGQHASNAYARDHHRSKTSPAPHPTLISTADIMKWFISIPVFLLSEVVVPIVQVSSFLWYDCKQRILGLQNQEERRFFLENIEQSAYSSYSERAQNETIWELDDIDEDRLTDEERQIMEIQRTATTAYKQVSSTVRGLWDMASRDY
ncbi:hypothetical protein BWQ96_07856 [Gracilariopsis chorda]|uniref:Uncharacterized protein n=1 Tax=Gracilariopsis chorda TaxID=448386 RepID=A0A2V3IJZ4_9FLOR|nr:hypothetical protein BWQ96_07856 [Gracilariopsis chorda]|eukprot:PXF42415.1 hypothetical protein BWQ96_07856 [Gracilariopsis chorda]